MTSQALQTTVQKGICAFCSGTGSGSGETPPPAQWTLAQVFDECAFPRSPPARFIPTQAPQPDAINTLQPRGHQKPCLRCARGSRCGSPARQPAAADLHGMLEQCELKMFGTAAFTF